MLLLKQPKQLKTQQYFQDLRFRLDYYFHSWCTYYLKRKDNHNFYISPFWITLKFWSYSFGFSDFAPFFEWVLDSTSVCEFKKKFKNYQSNALVNLLFDSDVRSKWDTFLFLCAYPPVRRGGPLREEKKKKSAAADPKFCGAGSKDARTQSQSAAAESHTDRTTISLRLSAAEGFARRKKNPPRRTR